MKQVELPEFGLDKLRCVDAEVPQPAAGEVLVKIGAASINYRDYQIVTGEFSPDQPLPIVPLSDGAGEVVALGDGVTILDCWELGLCHPGFLPAPLPVGTRNSSGCHS